LIANNAVRKAIRDGNSQSVYTAMESAAAEGMVTLEQSLAQLCRKRQITRLEALRCAAIPSLLEQIL